MYYYYDIATGDYRGCGNEATAPAGCTTSTDAPVFPAKPIEQVKAEASIEIDQTAGQVRSKYITTSPGQETTYTEKARQCEAYKAAGYPASPDPVAHAYVLAEANAKQCSYQVACDAILAERDQWAVLGAKIEEARRKAKLAVAASVDAEAVDVALQTGLAELTAELPVMVWP
ncbi:MAG: hypothetical protein AB7I29_07015 [Geobacter sp.]